MAGSLITEDDLRGRFGIVDDVSDARLTPAVRAAGRRLRGWVGDSVYQDALANSPENAERKDDLGDAEAALAMHFLILNLNTNITPGGVVLQAKEEGHITIQYASPAQTKDLAEQFLNQAEELARPWALTDGTPDAQLAFVEV